MEFSVLMSIYIKENPVYFEEALKSIIFQEVIPTEILIVEDGELTSELYKIIEDYKNKYSFIRTLKLEKNMGLGEALRQGILECKNEIVARMDTDDISKPNRFKRQLEIFKNNPEIDIVGGWIEEFEEKNNKKEIKSFRNVPEEHLKIVETMKKLNPFNHPTVMYKKSKVISSGNYNEKYNKLEDYYLWFRMMKNDCKFYNLQEAILSFRVSDNTFRKRNGKRMLVDTYKLYKEFYECGFINFYEFIRNIFIWSLYRILPIKIVNQLKKYFLRKIY